MIQYILCIRNYWYYIVINYSIIPVTHIVLLNDNMKRSFPIYKY